MLTLFLAFMYAKPIVEKISLEEKPKTKVAKMDEDDLMDLEASETPETEDIFKKAARKEKIVKPYPPMDDYVDESMRQRPVMVVGSYIGALWLLSNKKDSTSAKSGDNSLTCNIPAIVIGYGDVFAEHFYLGIEGEFGYGLKRSKDANKVAERARWHMAVLGHVGFYLSPSARLYGILGIDKTSYVREKDVTENGKTVNKKVADATGITGSFGAGLMITITSRFGFGIEGRYNPKKSWSFASGQPNENTKLSAWQMGAKAILFI